MVVEQGDLIWVGLGKSKDSSPSGWRPAVVIQSNSFNRSRINTVIVAAITSNRKYLAFPGNVGLAKGEAGIPKTSVVNVSQIQTIDRARLKSKIGKLGKEKLRTVLRGIQIVLEI